MLKKYETNELPNLRVHGRTDGSRSPIALFWSGSAIEMNVTGSELWLEYESDFGSGETYLRIEIDRAGFSRRMLDEGRHSFCVFRGFGRDEVKNVRIFRETQASNTSLSILSLSSDGEFMPVPERRLIEFFGDSVTSGEGLCGAQSMKLWIPAVFSSRGNYALRVADELDMDWSIVSQSGWGVYCSWNNIPDNAVPRLYDRVCAVANSPAQQRLGAGKLIDHNRHRPEITVVNLGANDSGAFNNPAWIDNDGVEHKLRLDSDGKPMESDLRRIGQAVYDFCAAIRLADPDTKLLWCYHMLSDLTDEVIVDAVSRFAADRGDENIACVKLPRADASLNGSRSHPGVGAHRLYADAIVGRLRELGWKA